MTFTLDDIIKLAVNGGALVYAFMASWRSKKQLKNGEANQSELRTNFEKLKTENRDIMTAYLGALSELEKVKQPGKHTPDPAVVVGSVTGQTPAQPAPFTDKASPSTTAIEGLLRGD